MHNDADKLYPMKLFMNDVYVKTFEFSATGDAEKEWKFVNTIINFTRGANEVRLETTGQSGPFIDEMYID